MSGRRSRWMFIHKCNIERSIISVDVTVVRDRKASWVAIYSNVPCWFDHVGSSLVDAEFGRVPIERYVVYFDSAGAGLLINDRLKKGNDYYIVESVVRHSDEDWHIQATVRKMNMSA